MKIRFPGGDQGSTSPPFGKPSIGDAEELQNSSIVGMAFYLAQGRDVLDTVASRFLATHY